VEWVDKALDSSVPISGPSHRRDFVHTPLFVYLLSKGDPDAVIASIIHIIADSSVTEAKKRIRDTSMSNH
jgi:hypothetical protein